MPVDRMPLHGEKPYLRVVGRLHIFRPVARKLERQAHVGLAAAQPYVADQDVAQFHGLMAGDLDGVRAACGRRLNRHLPAAVGSRDGRCGLLANLYLNVVARFRPAPDDIGFAALQDHVVAEDRTDEGLRLEHLWWHRRHARCVLGRSAATQRKQDDCCRSRKA